MPSPSSGEPIHTASARSTADTSTTSSWRGSERTRQHYTVPTHLKTPDKLLFGLTARQLLLLLTGGSLAYALYLQWNDITPTWELDPLWSQVLGLALVLPLVLLTLSTAFLQIADRPLEQWTIVFLHAHLAPRTYTWQSSKWEHDEAEEEAQKDDDKTTDRDALLEEEEDVAVLEALRAAEHLSPYLQERASFFTTAPGLAVLRAAVKARERQERWEHLSSTEGPLPKEGKQAPKEAARDPHMEHPSSDSFQRSASSGQKRREHRR